MQRHLVIPMLRALQSLFSNRLLLGHENIATTYNIYVKATEKRKQDTAAKLDSIFGGL